MRKSSFIVISVLAFLGCAERTDSDAVHGEPKANSNPSVVDRSLTTNEYLANGLPAIDRPWSSSDMMTTAVRLEAICKEGFGKLPKYESDRSGAVFARMTSDENFAFALDRSFPLDVRLPHIMRLLESGNRINKLYLQGFSNGEIADRSVIELLGWMLRVTAVAMPLINEFTASLNPDDPSHPVRMEGLERSKRGLATMVDGGLITLTERESYSRDNTLVLIRYMQGTFPTIFPNLPPLSRREFKQRIDAMRHEVRLVDLKEELDILYAKINTLP